MVQANKGSTNTRRHCMVVHAYYPVGETRVQRQASALSRQGYSVDVICLRNAGEAATENVDGVTIYRLPLKRHRRGGFSLQMLEYVAFFLLAFLKLLRLHPSKRYGVVQVHNLPDFLVFAAAIPRLLGARLILDLHDLMPEFFAARSSRPMNSLAVRAVVWQEQMSCRFAHHVITVTDVWKKTLVARGVSAHKVSVVMNVADEALFRRREPASERSDNEKRFNLVYHGTFTHRYGVDLLLHALNEVRREIPGVHLMLLGGGEYRDELIRLIGALELENHVTISSRMLPAEELPPVLLKANVGLVPNRSNIFTDGLLPTKLLEYVALGIPVVAAQTPTIAAYFDDSMVQFFEPGNVAELAQCIIDLHNDRQRLACLADASDAFNRRYNWDSVAAEYVTLVDRLRMR